MVKIGAAEGGHLPRMYRFNALRLQCEVDATDRASVQESFYLFALSTPALLERLMEAPPMPVDKGPQRARVTLDDAYRAPVPRIERQSFT